MKCIHERRRRLILAAGLTVLLAIAMTALWWASSERDVGIVDAMARGSPSYLDQYLVGHPGDVNALTVGDDDPTRTGVTPLMIACRKNDLASIQILLRHGADASLTDSREWDAFEHAAVVGAADAVSFLLDRDHRPVNPGGAVMAGAATLDSRVFGRLLRLYQDDARFAENEKRLLYDYAMYQAAFAKDAANLRSLVALGATGTVAAPYGRGLIHVAAGSGNSEAVDLLLRTGRASVDELDAGGATPLAAAVCNGRASVVGSLLEHGADMRVGRGTVTALGLAAMGGHSQIVSQLLLHGGRNLLEVPRDDGSTPLILAASFGDRATVQVLLDAGANTDARASDGRDPYTCARERKDAEGKLISDMLALRRSRAGTKVR